MKTTPPIKPADLDPTRLHTPSEVRQFQAETADYFQAIRAIEQAKTVKAQAEFAHQNRSLDDSEYFAMKVKEKAANDAKIAERAAAEKATALAEIDRLLASPASVEVMHRNEYTFIKEVIHWANRGYTLGDNGMMAMMPGLLHIIMDAPAAPKKAVKQ